MASGGATGTVSTTGDILAGNEGVWQVDSAQTSPLNRAFVDYLTDFAGIVHAAGRSMTVAFSQELLAPPDVNTSAGAWIQRFANGSTVLTATGFGSWGAGFVEGVAGSPMHSLQTGHGYITGNRAHLANGSNSGVWDITFVDADHYELTTLVFNSGGYVPAIRDAVFIELQTSQCCFNPLTVTAYLIKVYKQAAGILNSAGLTIWLQFGEVGWWFFSRLMSEIVGFASFTSPISIGTPDPHGFNSSENVIVSGVRGNTAANGTWPFVKTDATHGTLTGSVGNAAYLMGGRISGGGMAYYDANTAAAALVALGRVLASFWTQDDDPTINGGADVAFLTGLLKTHVDAIISAVLGTYAGAKFELLLPYDVDHATCYHTLDVPFPQGGRLNYAVNINPAWFAKAGSNLDRLKMEGLSWGATYRNLDRALDSLSFPYTVGTWAKADVAYLIPWFNGGCPWPKEWLAYLDSGIPLVNFWAVDHLILLHQELPPLPSQESSSRTRIG